MKRRFMEEQIIGILGEQEAGASLCGIYLRRGNVIRRICDLQVRRLVPPLQASVELRTLWR